jgi:hypothetical protein
MNTKANINNKGIKFAISNFKLENGLYLNPDIRRAWTIARDTIGVVECINPVARKGSRFNAYAEAGLPGDIHFFKTITMMHQADVYDALYLAAKRYHKAA